MNLPSRTVSYGESVISKFPEVLKVLQGEGLTAATLYAAVADKMRDVAEFVNVLDCLYVLGKVDIADGKVVLSGAGKP